MSSVHRVQKCTEPGLDVVFVHGLGGNAKEYWMADTKDAATYWPDWIATDLLEAIDLRTNVWSVDYEVSKFKWGEGALPLEQRSIEILSLLNDEGIGDKPVVFVTHSLGGLVVKEMLRDCETNDEYREIGLSTRGVVFISTPHAGSSLADSLQRIAGLITTDAIGDLKKNEPHLLKLNQFYQTRVRDHGIDTLCFGENHKTQGILVVDKGSANLGIPGKSTIYLDKDHISICKPESREHRPYNTILTFIKKVATSSNEKQKQTDPSLKHFFMAGCGVGNRLAMFPLTSEDESAASDEFIQHLQDIGLTDTPEFETIGGIHALGNVSGLEQDEARTHFYGYMDAMKSLPDTLQAQCSEEQFSWLSLGRLLFEIPMVATVSDSDNSLEITFMSLEVVLERAEFPATIEKAVRDFIEAPREDAEPSTLMGWAQKILMVVYGSI